MSKCENPSKAPASMPERVIIDPPFGEKKVLLHSCCAPCSCEVMAAMQAAGIEYSVFFYNPNIQPEKEYLLRKEENIRFAKKHNIEFIDADYDVDNWMARAKGMEFEPERGLRCTMCFDMRLERTALYAHENGFPVIATCLGISRWKNLEQINDCGERAVKPYEDVKYWGFNWRKKGGSARMIAISKEEEFYQQQYCGCAYSLRDSNHFRKEQGRPMIKIGEGVYTNNQQDSKA